jgi:hypothetical protein
MNEPREPLNEENFLAQTRKGGKETLSSAIALCAFPPLREKYFLATRLSIFLTVLVSALTVSACGRDVERARVPAEVQEVVANVGDQIAQERYEQIYTESSDLWKQDVTLEQSNEVFKTLRTKLGKVESRSLNSAREQQNSGGVLKGHVFILSYETRFERGEGMETFTLIEDNGRWLLARYFVNSTALQ